MMEHQFLTIKHRRWCVCCDLFQQKKEDEEFFLPKSKTECPNDAPMAKANRASFDAHVMDRTEPAIINEKPNG